MTDRRSRKKAETRRRLAASALALASEHGPHAVTVEQIADAAGVSPRTFFNYFASKDDAILGFDPEEQHGLVEHVAARPADEPPLVAIRRAVAEYFAVDPVDPAELTARLALVDCDSGIQASYLGHVGTMERRMTEVVAGRMAVDPDDDPRPAVAVAVGSSVFRLALQHASRTGRPFVDVADELFDALGTSLTAGLADAEDLGATSVRTAD